MSYIDMHAQHSLGREQAQAAADELAKDLAQKFDIAYHWQDDRICFDRSGVNGTITVSEDEIRARYQKNMRELGVETQVRARQIAGFPESGQRFNAPAYHPHR